MSVTLKQMRYAVAVARTGHFGRAAQECAISQPALSQQIIALEALFETALFDRLKTGVRPTPFGQRFVDLSLEALKAADAVSVFALGQTSRPDRPLRFGLIPTVAPYLLPDIFPRLTEHLPDLRLAVSENRTEDLLEGLRDGSLDVALIATDPPQDAPRLESVALFDDPFVLATARTEQAPRPLSLKSLPADRILLLDEGHCFRDQTIAACGLDGHRSSRTFAATSLSTIVEFVANGQGVTLLPEIALRKEGGDERIAVHALDDPHAMRRLSLVWRQATPYRAIFLNVADLIRSHRVRETNRADGSGEIETC